MTGDTADCAAEDALQKSAILDLFHLQSVLGNHA